MLRKALLTAAVLFSALSTHATAADACVRLVKGNRDYLVNRCGTYVNIRYCSYSRHSNNCRIGRYSGLTLRPGQRVATGTGRGTGLRWYTCRGRFAVPTGRPPTRCVNVRRTRSRTGGICPPTWKVAHNGRNTVCSCRGNYSGPPFTWRYYREGSRCRW